MYKIIIERNQVILNQHVRYIINECLKGNYEFYGVWLVESKDGDIREICKCEDNINNIYSDIYKIIKKDYKHGLFSFNYDTKFNMWNLKMSNENHIVRNPFINKSESELDKLWLKYSKENCALLFKFIKIEDDNTLPDEFRYALRNRSDQLNILNDKLIKETLRAETAEKELLKQKLKTIMVEKELYEEKIKNIPTNEMIPTESYMSVGNYLTESDGMPIAIEINDSMTEIEIEK